MLDKVGVGISTYNRLNHLKRLINSIKETAGDSKVDLFVADDGSTDGTVSWLKEQGIPFISGKNVGIAKNKNKILFHFQRYEHIFLLEDDVVILKAGWILFYLNARSQSNIHHFIFCLPGKYDKPESVSTYLLGPNIHHYHIFRNGGQFCYYSGRVVDTCGGFCSDFGKYGWEHCEFDERIYRAGLSGKYLINHVAGSEKFISYLSDVKPANRSLDIPKCCVENQEVYRKCRRRPDSELQAAFSDSYANTVFKVPSKYKIVVPVWNAEKWILKCLSSIQSQTLQNWEVAVVDDCSTDSTFSKILEFCSKDWRFQLIRASVRQYALANIVLGFKYLCPNNEDVLMVIDGDDWLADKDVFTSIRKLYSTTKCWVTYGQQDKTRSGEIGEDIRVPANYDVRRGRWVIRQLRTFKGFLWKNIKDKDLRMEGTGSYYPAAYDVAIMRPMMEMAGMKRVALMDRVVYCHNWENPNMTERIPDLYKLELSCDEAIKRLEPYMKLSKEALYHSLEKSRKHFLDLG